MARHSMKCTRPRKEVCIKRGTVHLESVIRPLRVAANTPTSHVSGIALNYFWIKHESLYTLNTLRRSVL